MSHLTTLTDALHLLGKAIDPNSVTKVYFEFQHSPTDIEGIMASWAFTVTLKGTKGISEEDGAQVLSFEQTWKGEGNSDVEAFQSAHKQVLVHLEEFRRLRDQEAQFAQQSVMTALSGPEDLTGLWRSDDTQGGALQSGAQANGQTPTP